MNIFLAAIIFSFFAVFAPNSHGDRPLLHAEPSNGTIKYSDFKLPIARLNAKAQIEQIRIAPAVDHNSFFLELSSRLTLYKPSFQLYDRVDRILSFTVAPIIFCEVLQV